MSNKQHLADFHFHTECSPDSTELLSKHIDSAVAQGFSQLCVTDHWDLVDDEPTESPNIPYWLERFSSVQIPPNFTLNFGVEMGDGYGNIPVVEDVLKKYPFDFVLGSVHALNINGGTSIYYGFKDCDTQEKLEQFFLHYFNTLLLQSQQTYFDSLSHIIYPFRYLPPASTIQVTNYMEQITATLEELIRRDTAMEFNTTQGSTLEIWRPILTRYQELGGTLLTLGSDAHRNIHTGLGIPQALTLLKSMGFSTYHTFTQRKIVEVPILS